ncbi:rhamnogalacturonan lyase [Streptomyces sulfonofaciens]|uniref:Rhamnogalacturonan lyase n=1 Tax=Streptomyces sulfonofaciens TaxID=68272 RepID=A0A919FZ36_9ACTN|nr:rhamnogalacturonan lyase [Streptomyces sulfonofaciens]GHH75187.1 rhamnogalacturonan lyase [Streptomyces sulfonofaciens]
MKRFHTRAGAVPGAGRRSARAGRLTAVAALVAGCTAALAPQAPAATTAPTGSAAARATGATVTAEHLDHAPVSVHTSAGNLVSWRRLVTDADDTAFNVYRAGTTRLTAAPVQGATNFFDPGAPATADYTVRPVVRGVEQSAAEHAIPFADGYRDVPISPPAGGSGYTYEANDASVGDLDGDGDLDFVLKWQPTNAKDNSQSGTTGNTVVDGCTLEGTRLWRVDLGRNIRSGAHYTQFQVFDYDGDGRAEVAMKTADGTVDGTGKTLGSALADYRNSSGYVLSGPEYLTMFDGRTGAALSTVDYVPPRGTVSSWGDDYGNRVDRFLAATAYVDGQHPSLIEARGYYTRTVISAWDFSGGRLTRRWTFDTSSSTNSGRGYDGQGNHNLSVADVDGDGRDEIVYGAMAVDDNGSGLWTTRNGHGDAMHVGDLDPSRAGLEEFKVDEDSAKPSSWMADARTGQILWSTPANGDNGRGVSGDIWAGSPGAESWSAAADGMRDTKGAVVGRKPSSTNFLAWWDGDTTRELLDGTHIDKYGTGGDQRLLTAQGVHADNGTKATPALSGDILGDWREEVVWPTSDNRALRIYSTPYTTDTQITTLLQDRQYREALAWQNTAYNQPPHPSFPLGNGRNAAGR